MGVKERKARQKKFLRQEILEAASELFVKEGYENVSMRRIAEKIEYSPTTIYIYFKDKAELFQALVDHAHDERFRLMQEAASRGQTIAEKLEEVVTTIFEFSLRNRELMRLAFATAFAAEGEAPGHTHCKEKGRRNFEFLRSLIEEGQVSGQLSSDFTADELTMGIYGQLNSYVMIRLLVPDCPLNRQTAKQVVRLFSEGAGRRPGEQKNGSGRHH